MTINKSIDQRAFNKCYHFKVVTRIFMQLFPYTLCLIIVNVIFHVYTKYDVDIMLHLFKLENINK